MDRKKNFRNKNDSILIILGNFSIFFSNFWKLLLIRIKNHLWEKKKFQQPKSNIKNIWPFWICFLAKIITMKIIFFQQKTITLQFKTRNIVFLENHNYHMILQVRKISIFEVKVQMFWPFSLNQFRSIQNWSKFFLLWLVIIIYDYPIF